MLWSAAIYERLEINFAFFVCSGPIPNGADAVVQVEDTVQVESAGASQKRVRVLKQVVQGLDIRPVVWNIRFYVHL